MKSKIEILKSQALAALKAAKSDAEVRDLEVKYLGRNGLFNDIMKSLKDLSDEEKRTVGKLANETKTELEAAVQKKYAELEMYAFDVIADKEWMDVTVPGKKPDVGHRHLISKFIDDLEVVFGRMGFAVAEGPDIETEHYNFDQLNMPADHPSRDMQDTFWVKNLKRMVLRTHTSPVQIRHMESHKPPVRVISLGKTFRKDSDATHSPMFHQIEGLMVDTDISIANLKAVLTHLLQQVFEDPSIKTRFRTSYFPFVEPGMEVDCTCPICHGEGKLADNVPCKLCKQCGWLEIGGAGMVHPKVLENVGYDSKKYTGFAFGFGVDRMVMIRHRVNHLRLLFENDLRFIDQF
ncbi:phenylalanine--tRNA ligase subunit alpha [Patescibacteria group bacterium]|nr:phenylalanine--tRNA ligase subunit alpha [Patescibacteria group bacterium]MBU1015902.1 phenylalanine--tRNA ligase subunit alpha [Patescibacteria group bacterium]MBU1685071.1 phenylalanine--tRNA ligase subunit alpha [Patescibacteria group bacterium]MBU1938166.1 phenylalanine--tRNA ligase subunit alpha [Patescibacteria group bacterium]